MILQKADSVDIFVADITAVVVVVVFCKRIHVVLYFLKKISFFLESVAAVLCGWSNNQKRLGHPGWFS